MPTAPPYSPDDSNITRSALEYLHSHPGELLRAQVAALLTNSPDPSVSDVARLRASFRSEAVHAALAIGKLQPKARQKFSDLAPGYIWALPEALEQATDSAVANHKAARFAALNPAQILDLCAGIGGDTRALAQIAPTTAVDLSQPRLACLQYNLQTVPPKHPIETRCADISSLLHSEFRIPNSPCLFHIDPARRHAGKRSAHYENLIPNPKIIEKFTQKFAGGALKLSPAVDFDTLPPGHLELISHNRAVVQAVLWLGTLAALFPPNARTATMLTNHALTASYTATPNCPNGQPMPPLATWDGNLLYEVDGAFTRSALASALAHSLHLAPLTPDAGYLLGRSPASPHPALTPFVVLATIPFSEKRVLQALQKAASNSPDEPGPIEVKTRGKIPGIDTDRLQRLFSQTPTPRRTVLIFRHDSTILAAIARRISSPV